MCDVLSVFSEHQLQHFARCSAISYLYEYTCSQVLCSLRAVTNVRNGSRRALRRSVGSLCCHKWLSLLLCLSALLCLPGVHHPSLAPARVCVHVRINACVMRNTRTCAVHKLIAFRAPRSPTSAVDSPFLSFPLHSFLCLQLFSSRLRLLNFLLVIPRMI